MIKKYFVTGLVILLPLALTFAIVIFIFNLLTEPFVGLFKGVLDHYGLLETGFLFLTADQLQKYFSQLLILLLLFFLTAGLGVVARWFFIHYFIRFWDYILHRIPVVSTIYKSFQDVINTIFSSDARAFKQVVIVPYPKKGTYSIGFVTNENLPGISGDSKENLIAVFVPTTPNPTCGFLMLYDEKDITYVDMTVEDAFKYVISCGVVTPLFAPLSKKEAKKRRENKE